MLHQKLIELELFLKKEDWYIAMNGYCTENYNGKATALQINLKYRAKNVVLLVIYNASRSSYGVRRNDYGRRRIATRSTLDKTHEVILDKVNEALVDIEKNIKEEEERQQKQIMLKKKVNKTVESFERHQSKIRKAAIGTYTPHARFAFVMSDKFELTINIEDINSEDVRFNVTNVYGTFTKEEMETLMDWLAACPSVVADRILK